MPTLRELNAVFISRFDPVTHSFHEQGEQRAGVQGLLFDCPLTTHICEGKSIPPGTKPCHSHSVLVWFRDSGVPPEATPKYRWVAQGDSIDNLTLSPSINLDVPYTDEKGVTHPSSCKWHGFIQNGVAK